MPKDEWLKAKNKDTARRVAAIKRSEMAIGKPRKPRHPGHARPQSRRSRNMVMPFGMHKGKELKKIPLDYLAWLLGLESLDEDIRGHVERYMISRQSRIAAKRGHVSSAPKP